MKKLFYILMLAVVSITTACTPEEDDLFGESSANRVDAAMKAGLDVLTSAPNGWKMAYFPSETKAYGGYNVLLKFNKDRTVQASSEFYEPDFVAESFFSIKQSAGVILSMDTYNDAFHIFSDPSDPLGWGGKGEGLGGDYDFLILEATPEKVVLKGKKTGGISVLTPMEEGASWEGYLTAVQERDASIQAKLFSLTLGETEVNATIAYRNLIFRYMDGEEPVQITAPYVVTADGYLFAEPLEILGETIEGFNYNPETDSFTSFGSVQVEMFIVVPNINQQFVDGDWFISYSNLGKFAQMYFDVVKSTLEKAGEELQFAYMGTSKGNTYAFIFQSSGYRGYLDFSYQLIGKDKIALQFAMNGDNNGIFYHNKLGMHYALVPFGYDKAKVFTITTDDLKSPTYITLTEDANPENQITLVADFVAYPFKN